MIEDQEDSEYYESVEEASDGLSFVFFLAAGAIIVVFVIAFLVVKKFFG